MEEAIIARLLADSGVAAIASTRVFPGARPQASALPAIVLNRVSGGPLYADDGEVGLEQGRIQIDCWADTYSGAKLLARAVTACLSAFDGTVDTKTFEFIELENEPCWQAVLPSRRDGAPKPFRSSLCILHPSACRNPFSPVLPWIGQFRSRHGV
jgi:hypothetical protein